MIDKSIILFLFREEFFMKKTTLIAGTLAAVTLGTVAAPISVGADSLNTPSVEKNSIVPKTQASSENSKSSEQFINTLLNEKDSFVDKGYAQQLETNINKRGKGTMAAKVAAKAMKAALNKIGPTAWNNTVKKMGLASMPIANWKGINKVLDIAVNSSGTIEDALVNAGVPSWVAHALVVVLL